MGDQKPNASPSEVTGHVASRIHRPGDREDHRIYDPDGRRGGQSSRAWPAIMAGSPAGPAANGDIDRLPFSQVQDGIAGQLRGSRPSRVRDWNPPGDDQVHGQGRFQSAPGAQLPKASTRQPVLKIRKNFDTPARFRTTGSIQSLGRGVGRPVAQQTPVERLDPGRRDSSWLAARSPSRVRRLSGCSVTRSVRTVSTTDRPAGPAGPEDEAHLAQDQRQRQSVPPMVTLGQAAVVGGSDQPVDLRLPACPGPREFVDVAFPVGDVDPAGVGQTRASSAQRSKPSNQRMLSLASIGQCRFLHKRSPGHGSTAKRPVPQHAIRCHRQGRMRTARAGACRSGAPVSDARLSGIVQFRAVLHAQDHRMGHIRSKAAFPVASTPPVNPRLRAPTADTPPGSPPQPPQATGMLALGCAPNRSTTRTNRRFNRASPNFAPPNSAAVVSVILCSTIICTNSTRWGFSSWDQDLCNGQILEVGKVHDALCERTGRRIQRSVTYKLLHRHDWRKIVPRSRHPRADQEAQASFKKTGQTL